MSITCRERVTSETPLERALKTTPAWSTAPEVALLRLCSASEAATCTPEVAPEAALNAAFAWELTPAGQMCSYSARCLYA